MAPLSDRLKMNQATSGGTSAIVTTVFGAEEEPKSRRKKTSQQELQERYEAGDPEVDLLGEPSGKCDYYVLYSKSKPSPPTTSFVIPESRRDPKFQFLANESPTLRIFYSWRVETALPSIPHSR